MKKKNQTDSNNWRTPKDFYDKLDSEFHFDFDPCPFNAGEITPENDGLLIPWGKRNFINPPYSRLLKESFVKRAISESKKGAVCVMLLPVSTSTALFHDLIQPNALEIRFVRGRLYFVSDDPAKNGRPMYDSMVVVF